MTRRLAREEGLLAGLSAGTAMVAALGVPPKLESGGIATTFPTAAPTA